MATSPKTPASLSTLFSVGTVGLLTSATILRIYWRRQGCAKGRPIIGAKERVGIVKEQQIERLHGEPTFEPTSEMLVAIEEGTRSAQTERMYTADEIKERIRGDGALDCCRQRAVYAALVQPLL